MRRRNVQAVLAGAALAVFPLRARAIEVGSKDPVVVDVTVASSLTYNADNRNSRDASVERSVDDDWGVFYDRLNLQASYHAFQLGLRLDTAWFYTGKTPTEIALELLEERNGGRLPAVYGPADAAFFEQKLVEASRNLTTRQVDYTYPAKYYAGYSKGPVEATIGDFYAQLGRGLVLSVRKQDELSSDTTVRGARMTGRTRAGDVSLKLSALGGTLNPLRIDEASGRYLGVTNRVTTGIAAITEAGMPRAQASPFDDVAPPTYAPDRLVGAELEGGTRAVKVAFQGTLLERTQLEDGSAALSPGVVRSADSIRTGSVSTSLPDLFGSGAAYVEAALQDLSYPAGVERDAPDLPDPGHAIYASVDASFGPLTLTAEGKHYRRFFPLLANVDVGKAPEFSTLAYSAPPTTESIWTDTEFEGFNTCVTGGRLEADVRLRRGVSVFAWVGRYATWAESVANEQCRTVDSARNDVWDTAVGLEKAHGRSRVTATMGTRFDDAARDLVDPHGGTTRVFYREAYVRHDLTAPLGGRLALKLQGASRYRHQTQGGAVDPWLEADELAALDIGERFTLGGGFEYTSNPLFPPTYFNGSLAWKISSASNVSLFVGQRRGGLRCVSGVCRVYPPFEGARVDATLRF